MLTIAWASVAQGANALPAVSDGEHLWRVAIDPNQEASVVYHHPRDEADEDRLQRISAFRGRLVPGGLAAEDGRLWLFFQGGAVQQVAALPTDHGAGWYYNTSVMPPLPADARPIAVAAADGRAWALVREDAATASRRDVDAGPDARGEAGDAATERFRRRIYGLPPQPVPDPATESEADPTGDDPPRRDPADDAEDPTANASPLGPRHRLLVARATTWEEVDLPEDWPGLDAAAVRVVGGVGPGGEASRPALLAIDRGGGGRVFRFSGDGWQAQSLDGVELDAGVQTAGVEGQLVLASVVPAAPSTRELAVEAEIVRLDGGSSLRVAQRGNPARLWRIGPWGDGVGLFTAPQGESTGRGAGSAAPVDATPAAGRDTEHPATATPVTLTAVSLQGEARVASRTLEPRWVSRWEGHADYIVLLIAMGVATATSVITWKTAALPIALPKDAGPPADLFRRMTAMLIDLAPAAIAAAAAFGLAPAGVTDGWPMLQDGLSWRAMAPSAVAIGGFVLHTAVSEAVFGTSLGKALLGLRVIRLDGGRPAAWQAALRGGLKAVDLLLMVTVIIAIVTPAKQRLGDLAARTVVVANRTGGDAPRDGGQDA